MSKKNFKRQILRTLILICLVLLAIVIYFLSKGGEAVDKVKEPVSNIIDENEELAKDKSGAYLFESLEGNTIGEYLLSVPKSTYSEQKNACVVELISKIKEKGLHTCYQNGYTYGIITDGGEGENATSLGTDTFVLNDDKYVLGYEFNDAGVARSNDEPTVFFFRLPTDKEITGDRLSYTVLDEYIELLNEWTITYEDTGTAYLPYGVTIENGYLYYNGELIDPEDPPVFDMEYEKARTDSREELERYLVKGWTTTTEYRNQIKSFEEGNIVDLDACVQAVIDTFGSLPGEEPVSEEEPVSVDFEDPNAQSNNTCTDPEGC